MRYFFLRLKRFCGFVAGIVFFIAGIFKLLDPVGAGFVMKEYMNFFHIGFMSSSAKIIATILAFAETLVGAALISGVWRRTTAVVALAFQAFFTVLTLILVIYNPEMDCGCFGEAIHLSHLETFIKNIILLSLLLVFAFPFRYLGGPKRHKYASFAIVTVSVLLFSVYSWYSLPLVDYTAFKPAAPLQAGNAFSVIEEDQYEAVFIYEKDGQQVEYSLENLPDSTWSFVETRAIEKANDEMVNLSFYDNDGQYQDTLAAKGKVMVLSIYEMRDKPVLWTNVSNFVRDAAESGFRPMVLVSATTEQIDKLKARYPEISAVWDGNIYYSDFKTLGTLNRSNGGVTYFSDGYLIKKWPARNRPDKAELEEIYSGDDTETILDYSTVGNLAFQAFLLYIFAVMLLL